MATCSRGVGTDRVLQGNRTRVAVTEGMAAHGSRRLFLFASHARTDFTDVKGHLNLHAHGHLSCMVTDTSFARVKASLEERVAPSFHLGLMLEGHHPLA
jgi:hypothetical protein